MPGKDTTVWTQTADGSWTRQRNGVEETTGYDPYVKPETPDDLNATQGAVEAAAEHGVDISTVTGTGAGGRITKADVEAAAE